MLNKGALFIWGSLFSLFSRSLSLHKWIVIEANSEGVISASVLVFVAMQGLAAEVAML